MPPHHHKHDPSSETDSNKKAGNQHAGHQDSHDHHAHHAMMVADFKRRFFVSMVVTLPILILSPMIQGWLGYSMEFEGAQWLLLALSAFIYGYGGWPFLKGMVDELKDKTPGMMTLVAVAVSVAFFYSAAVVVGLAGKLFFWETATLIDLMLLGHWIEMRSVMGASNALQQLAELLPAEAHLVTSDGGIEDVPADKLTAGDRVLVRSSEKIPADGVVVEGGSSVNESMLTGESKPVTKREGDEVIAGALNGQGTLTIEVKKTGKEGYLSQVIELVKSAQDSRSKTQDLANRAAFYLTILAIGVGALTFLSWFFWAGRELSFAIERTVTVMVITCPHALGLAIPLVVAVSTSLSARNGLLIRNRAAFERARNLDTVVFDKTGTLTEGRFGVSDMLVFGEMDEDAVLRLAAAVERGSEHPIAAGILREAEARELDIPPAGNFEAITGKGVKAEVEGTLVRILSPNAIEAEGISIPDKGVEELGRQGKTVVYVMYSDENRALGAIALTDVIRASSAGAIQKLHEMNVQAFMLTGDKQTVADYVAAEIGLDHAIAEVLPDEKSKHIQRLKEEGRRVAMTGDGVNDAPALATADVGIAVGAGTDVAIEAADIVLVDSDPQDVVRVIKLARATYKKMIQNLWYAGGYNIITIPLAAGVLAPWGILLSPAVGAVLMSLSTVVVAINARFISID